MLPRRPNRSNEELDQQAALREMRELLRTPIEASDLSMAELSRQQVQEQPERRLGAMSPEDLSAVEVGPKPAGQVLRGRVGAGAPEPKPAFSAEAPDLGNAKSATGKSAVLRQPVGGDPLRTARRLADIVAPHVTDEEIAQEDSTLNAQGYSPAEREKRAIEEARQFAVMSYAKRKEDAKAKYQDAVNRARADEENQGWLEQTLRGIADIAAAYGGQGPNTYTSLDKKERKATREGAEKRAKEEMDTTLAEGNTADQARMLAQRLRSAGIAIPEGMETQNPEAFNAVYGKVAPEKDGDGMSASLAYRMGRDEKLDERHFRERQEDRSWRTGDREDQQGFQRETAEINREEQARMKRDEQARNIESFTREAESNIDALVQQIGETGTFEATGPANQDFERRVNQLSVALAKLADPDSVAREGEVALARKGLVEADPFTRDSTAKTVLENVRRELADRRLRAYEIRGLPVPGGSGPAKQGGTPDRNEVKRRFKSGEITREEARRLLGGQ